MRHVEFKGTVWEADLVGGVDDAAVAAINAAYEVGLAIFEQGEHLGVLHGNGHHMAQEFAQKAAQMVRERWIGPTDASG